MKDNTYVTWEWMEEQLDGCPLCGGYARIVSMESQYASHTTTVRCSNCGLTLEWTQPFWISEDDDRLPADINFITAWNRRANK